MNYRYPTQDGAAIRPVAAPERPRPVLAVRPNVDAAEAARAQVAAYGLRITNLIASMEQKRARNHALAGRAAILANRAHAFAASLGRESAPTAQTVAGLLGLLAASLEESTALMAGYIAEGEQLHLVEQYQEAALSEAEGIEAGARAEQDALTDDWRAEWRAELHDVTGTDAAPTGAAWPIGARRAARGRASS